MNSAIGASKKAVGYSFYPGKTGLQITDDFAMKLKTEFVLGDPNDNLLYIPCRDDDTERPVEMCSPEADPLQNANGNDEVIIIAGTRHIQRRSERMCFISVLLSCPRSFSHLNVI